MHPDDLMKPDLPCEVLVKAGGMLILLFLFLILVLALTQVSAQTNSGVRAVCSRFVHLRTLGDRFARCRHTVWTVLTLKGFGPDKSYVPAVPTSSVPSCCL
jgi:hypothetical protein